MSVAPPPGGERRPVSQASSRDFALARKLVPILALLRHAGYPPSRNGFCPFHGGNGGRAFSVFRHRLGHDYFVCHGCGVQGDVVDLWFDIVGRSPFAPPWWSRPHACGDLLAHVREGLIDMANVALARGTPSSSPPSSSGSNDDLWGQKLRHLASRKREEMKRGRFTIKGRAHLPEKRIIRSLPSVITGLFPRGDGWLMLTPRINWHPVKTRNEWLKKGLLMEVSFTSQNYLSRGDLDGACDPAFAKSNRKWLVIEGDLGSLEEQWWIAHELAQSRPLACACWSGNKSLHSWFDVEGLGDEERFEFYAHAIELGISDAATWRPAHIVRLPGGLNHATGQRQRIIQWEF
jgi:hypothetical protein